MEITKMLTLSTAHITEETANKLDRDPNDNNLGLCIYNKGTFGWYIYLNSIKDIETHHKLPDDLFKCILLAQSLNCEVLCFDCDGPEEQFLPTYEW